jgi:cytochrome c oxidase subunit 2
MNFDELLRKLLFLPDAATGFADEIDHLHFFVISVTMLGSAAVFIIGLYFIIRYRRTAEPTVTPSIRASKTLEALVISTLLGLFVVWWLIGFGQYISYSTPPAGADEVYVTAKQWMWKFSYPDGRATIGALVVPVHRDIRLVMTSRDVIHSFYVPAFRIKRDVLPGRYSSAWFRARQVGTYDVFCAEFCGTSHSMMRASVVVLSQDDYEAWLAGGQPNALANVATRSTMQGLNVKVDNEPTLSMAEQGRRAASKFGCFACHTVDGQPHIGPTWYGLYGQVVELANGTQRVADEEYLTRSMMDPMVDVVRGYRPTMPTYLGTLPQPQAAAIVEYIRSLVHVQASPQVQLPKVEVVTQQTALPTQRAAAVGARDDAGAQSRAAEQADTVDEGTATR